jgi:hypothetical protein
MSGLEEPAVIVATRRYLRGEITHEQLREAEAASDPLERATWMAKRTVEGEVERATLRADNERLRSALTRAAAFLDTVLDHEAGAGGVEVTPDYWYGWVTRERDAARGALDGTDTLGTGGER